MKYDVKGMSCAACQARVEKAVSSLPDVKSCSVSLLTNSMNVEGNVSSEDVIKAVENAGYQASVTGEKEEVHFDYNEEQLKNRLIISVVLLIILMYFSMGVMMWHFPAPALLNNHVALVVQELVMSLIIMFVNRAFFTSGFKALFHRAPNMDTLVALGSSIAFVYSFIVLLLMIDAMMTMNMNLMHSYMDRLYFESAAMIPTLITVGKYLEAISKGRTTSALQTLMKLTPKTAILYKDGKEREVSIDEIHLNDIVVVKPGAHIPVDGVVIEGSTSVDESLLTGESLPVDKNVDAHVYSGTTNTYGRILVKTIKIQEDTTLSQIIQMVSDAATSKAPISRIADKVSGIFVPAVIGISLIVFVIWMILGKSISFSIARAISVLVISCPCALGLATPVAIMVGNGVGFKNGILYKTSESLEVIGKATTILLDKTGTITKGEPEVTDITTYNGVSEKQLLRIARAIEKYSEHPLSKAIMNYTQTYQLSEMDAQDFKNHPGNGLSATINKMKVFTGNSQFINQIVQLNDDVKETVNHFASQGKTPLLFSTDHDLLGIISVSDVIKEDSKESISQLKGMGLDVYMLTGDNEQTAQAIGKDAGVDHVVAGVLPDGKEEVVRRLMRNDKVIMVGDGINDAPALTRADIGVAIGAGTDVAIDAADIVVMNNSLIDVSAAIRLSRATIKNIHENLFWAFFYNIICIPVAAGLFIFINGWEMNPMLSAAAMSLSSFFVCMNALRLNLVNIYDKSKDRKVKRKEKHMTTKTLNIEGMMCMHCEATVKKALEAVDGVVSADVSHEENKAVVTLDKDVDNAVLTQAVEDKDYKVVDIK